MAERVWKVSELIRQINVELFRYNDISVEGEATNVVRSAAGHIYFSIKDSRAQMRVVLFATNSRFLRFRIENGLQLVVRGRLTLYEQKGEFQLNAVAVEPAGLGALQLAFEQLKKQLADEGLFDPARKKPIPMLPQRIAIVTSPTGAAIRDVLTSSDAVSKGSCAGLPGTRTGPRRGARDHHRHPPPVALADA